MIYLSITLGREEGREEREDSQGLDIHCIFKNSIVFMSATLIVLGIPNITT